MGRLEESSVNLIANRLGVWSLNSTSFVIAHRLAFCNHAADPYLSSHPCECIHSSSRFGHADVGSGPSVSANPCGPFA